ncbi:MAG: hypothetical protein IJU23_08640 [Proteobacteria bacterium]|nr:hypothetical protein [Pseudomonadota bacterium]
MPSLEELKEILAQDPENFVVLHDLALHFRKTNYSACFAMVERAIASYEKNPLMELQSNYFDMKRLHQHILRDHLPEILGPAYHLVDERWVPVFRNGRLREMAWNVTEDNIQYILPALTSVPLKKMYFLSITVSCNPTLFMKHMVQGTFTMLKTLNLHFFHTPDLGAFVDFFESCQVELAGLSSFGLRMPRINNTMAIAAKNGLNRPESFSLTSMDRTGIQPDYCEFLADDVRSSTLTRLALVGTSIGNEGLFTLFESDNFESLQTLDLHDGVMTNGATMVIVSAHSMPALRTIDLSYNTIDAAGLNRLKHATVECKTDHQHERPLGR